MATNYPTSLDTGSTTLRTDITATTELDDVGFYHDEQHVNAHGAVIAVETKLGVGSSDASAAGAGTVLVHSGSGSTGWSAAATGVTSVGTLSSLTVSGDVTVDTDTLHVDSTNNRVGIGTTSPSSRLEISDSNPSTLTLRSTNSVLAVDNEVQAIDFYQSDASGGAGVSARIVGVASNISGAEALTFHTGQAGLASVAERMRIDSSGNVGIGTTSPGSPLHLFGAGDGVDQIRISSTGGTVSEYGFLAANASTNVMRYGYWTGSGFGSHHFEGNVGINDTTPSFTLDVSGQARVGGGDNRTPNASGDGHLMINGSGYTGFASLDGSAMWVGHNSASRDLRLATDETERVRITSGGLVEVGQYGASQPGIDSRLYCTTSNDVPVLNLYSVTTTTTSVLAKGYSHVAGTAVLQFVIRTDGDFESRTNSYGAISDLAIKQDIVDAPSQWDDIKAVQLRKFRLIDDVNENGEGAQVMLGVIAQELEAAGMGGLVVDADEDQPVLDENGEPTGEFTNDKPHKSVKYSVLLLKALGALQEAMTRIEALEVN